MKLPGLKIILGVLLAGSAMLAAAADAPTQKPLDVRDLMSVSQFHQSGLDKLTPDELQALNAWLNAYAHPPVVAATAAAPPVPSVAPIPAPAPAAAAPAVPAPAVATGAKGFGGEMLPQKKSADDTPDVLQSRILGNFQGWSGRGVFKLENGQVWVQSDSSSFDTNLQDPVVVIKKMAFGNYLLTLPGHSGTVYVRRVQ